MDACVSFNLVDKPWIRARDGDGSVCELSLLELFSEAPRLHCLANDLPTQDFAILRMLLAILQRAISPNLDDEDDPAEVWGKLWDAEELPMDDIAAYLRKWHDRFDLFDPEKPFMQVAGLQATNGGISETKKIIADVPDGTPLFTIKTEGSFGKLAFAEAARWLVHIHAFDTAGIKTGTVGDPRAKGGKSYPIGTGWAGKLGGLVLEGQTVRETLLINLVLWNGEGGEMFSPDDLPAWEQNGNAYGVEGRLPSGCADIFTWQSRRVRLKAKADEVIGLILTNGDKLDSFNMNKVEPMTGWRRSPNQEKKLGITPVYLPATHFANRALWRGLDSVFSRSSDEESKTFLLPGIIAWAEHLSDANGRSYFEWNRLLHLHAIGFEYGTQNSVIVEAIDDKLDMNPYLFSPEGASLVNLARQCVERTDEAVFSLGRFAANLCQASGGEGNLVTGAREDAKAEAYYEIDSVFRSWFARLGPQSNPSEARDEWHRQARTVLKSIASELMEEASPGAIVGTAIKDSKGNPLWMTAAKAEAMFFGSLCKALPIASANSDERED